MRVVKENKFENVFPMQIVCKQIKDKYGFSYGREKDFCGSELEIDAEDIKKHPWNKYPDWSGVDYGVVCPVCGEFIPVDEKLIPRKVMDNAEEIRLGR